MCGDLNASNWIALCAGFVALLALTATLWQSLIARRHNFLSVRPIIDIYCHSRTDEVIGISFENCGPGPAFILSVKVTFLKTIYNLFNSSECEKLFDAFSKNGLGAMTYSFAIPSNSAVIAPGKRLDLFTITDLDNRKKIATKFNDIMHNVKLEVSYSSLYDQSYAAEYDRPIVECA